MNSPAKKKGQDVIYEMVTDRIISALEKGVVPWRKTWRTSGMPTNLVSKKEYRGVNVMLLACAGYSSAYWVTFKQAASLGGKIRTGEKGMPVVFWKFVEGKPDADGKKRSIPFARYYTAFNLEQCDGIPSPDGERAETDAFVRDAVAEAIVRGMPMPPVILEGKSRAAYHPKSDTVFMPDFRNFLSTELYYGVLFHELIHSTGHVSRLARDGVCDRNGFGSERYGKEELIAEMAAAFLCAECGISNDTIDDSAAYIAGWLDRLRQDSKLLVQAGSKAQRAVDFVLGRDSAWTVKAEKSQEALS